MLTITFLSTILALFFTIIFIIFSNKRKPGSTFFSAIIYVIIFLIAYCISYVGLPSRNLLSLLFINAVYSIPIGIIAAFESRDHYDTNYDIVKGNKTLPAILWLTLIIVFSTSIIGNLHSHMSVKPVYNSITAVKSNSNEAPTFKRGETPVAITYATARNRMNKSMSDVPNPQYYTLGDIEAQYYKGKPVYVASLEYDGFFASHKAKKIPGYFIIDATDVNAQPKFVNKSITYATSGWFSKKASRKLYRSYPTWLKADSSIPQLEINDNGDPYLVETMYKSMPLSHRINYKDLHTVVMNADTGNSKMYNSKNLPKWVDEGITSDVAESINYAYGKYKNGFWNFSKSGVMVSTNSSVTPVFNKDKTISYFTDFTRDGSGDSALGYSMINARTGKLTFYKTQGIMDSDGAVENANQNYKAQQWKASMPIIYNINGRPVWVMSILDKTKAFRGYYYLDASNQTVNASGSNATQTLDSFREALVSGNVSAGNTNEVKTETTTGVIDRMAIITNGSNSNVLLSLKGSKNVYTINTSDFPNASLAKVGDKVKLTSKMVSHKPYGNVSDFNNLNM